jgi:hypothetical protein
MRGLGYPPMYGRGPNNLQCVTHYISRLSPRNHYYDRNVDTNVDAARLEVSSIKTSFTRSLMTSFTREEVFFFSSKKVFP